MRVMCSSVLALQAIVLGLTTPVLLTLTDVPTGIGLAVGLGLMAAFDLPSGEVRDRAIQAMEDADMLVLASGHRSIRFRPALNLSEQEASEGIARITRSLRTVV